MAEVSTATVSYVLNNTPNQTISAATQQRVRTAAATLGYLLPHTYPESAGATAAPIVLLNVGADAVGKSMGSVIRTMQDELRRYGRTLVVAADADEVARQLRETRTPVAVVDVTGVPAAIHDADIWGCFRGRAAGFAFHSRMQLQHLAARGHRHIALALPDHDIGVFGAARVAHAHNAAHELGLPPLTEVRMPIAAEATALTDTVRNLAQDSAVTAVAALDDEIALTVLTAMARLGYRAPGDLAVIGFDGNHQGHPWEPPLTTVCIDTAAYGRRAARLAADIAAQDWTEAPSEIIERASA